MMANRTEPGKNPMAFPMAYGSGFTLEYEIT